MSNQGFAALINNLPAPGYSGTAYNTSTSLTDVNPAPNPTVKGGSAQSGTTFRVRARLKFSNTATPTLLLGLYWGGVAGVKLCAIGATTTTTGVTNWPIQVDGDVTINTTGTSGTATASGIVLLGTSLTAMTLIPMDAAAIAAVTVDTTIDKALTLGAQWGTNSASNTLQVIQFTVEQLD